MIDSLLLWIVAPSLVIWSWGFLLGFLPIPWGYDRGKVKWLMWCGTGHHFHTVYIGENGFQTLHPREAGE